MSSSRLWERCSGARVRTRFIPFILSIAILFISASTGFASSLKTLLPDLSENEYSDLLAGSTLIAWPGTAADMRFSPKGEMGEALRTLPEQFKVSVYVESAFLIPGIALSEKIKLDVVNELLNVETLSGVTYYSERRDAITILFDNVYQVAQPGSKTIIAAETLSELPDSLGVFIHLKDSNFGSSWYEMIIKQLGGGLLFSLQNQKPLSFMMIRAFSENDVRMRIIITSVDEGIYVAAICAANPARLASSLVDMYSAMEKRLRAVQGWVVERIAGNLSK